MDENEHHKEIYAVFGLAMFMAQVLEHGIVNALVVCDLIPNRRDKAVSKENWAFEVDQFMDGHFEGTMGRLIKSFGTVTTVSPELEQGLASSLKMRNFLAHRYFRERDTAWMTKEGRDGMIEELREASNLFARTDELLDELIIPLCQRYGLTQEVWDREVAAYKVNAIK